MAAAILLPLPEGEVATPQAVTERVSPYTAIGIFFVNSENSYPSTLKLSRVNL